MTSKISDILFPPNSRRRLFATLIARAFAQPRDFFRYVNLSSFRYFLNYLRNADPELVERMVDEVLARDRAQASDVACMNHHFLKVMSSAEALVSVPRGSEPVDIIIPIFNAPELTAACIASVLANSDNCRLILVNDASPDERVKPLLDGVCGVPERNIEVIVRHNELNIGFVKTVNAAYALTRHHFVILNSDTEVPPGWLDRLFAPIFSEPDRIASVTPFSNAGMACSFPEPDRDNPLFKGLSPAELDGFFRNYGSGEPIELFSGVGFCIAFNRAVVERIGLFDEETFGKGYGEEVDWSLRAYDAGFCNVLVPNLFVYHKHGASFGAEEKSRLMEQNQERVWKRHGRHMTRLREMAVADTPRAIRDTVAVVTDAQSRGNSARVAILDMDIPGGATNYSTLLIKELRRRGLDVVHLAYNGRQGYLRLRVVSGALDKTLILPPEASDELMALLELLRADHLVVNELFNWPDPRRIMGTLANATIPYVVLIHDFFLVCPSPFLMDRNGVFCGIPGDPAVCSGCLPANSQSLHREFYGSSLDDLHAWHAAVRPFLSAARGVICFSQPSLDYLARAYPELTNLTVNEHAIPDRESFIWQQRRFDGSGTLNLAIIGHLFPIKGERVVKAFIDSPRLHELPVSLTVFGDSPLFPPGYVSNDGRVIFLGSYRRDELPQLLEQHGIHAVLITSILPETFSYTTSEAILLGYPVICFNLGAQAERVRKHRCGIVVDDISANGLLAVIERIIRQPGLVEELSRNARDYVPAMPEQHFGALIRIIEDVGGGMRNEEKGTKK